MSEEKRSLRMRKQKSYVEPGTGDEIQELEEKPKRKRTPSKAKSSGKKKSEEDRFVNFIPIFFKM